MSIPGNDCGDFHRSIFLAKDAHGLSRASQPLSYFVYVGNGCRNSNDPYFTVQTHDSAYNCFQSSPPFFIIEHMNFVYQQACEQIITQMRER